MALVPFPGSSSPHDLDPDPDFRTHANRILRRDPGADGDRDDDEQDEGEAKMSFLEHLDELRKRIIWAAVSIFVGFIIAFIFIQQLFDFVMRPLQAGLPAGQHLIYTEPTEAFVLYLTIAGIAGAVIALPLVMTQVWLFIAPGLYAKEKKLAIPFVILSSTFFVLGAWFGHSIVFPMSWRFFASMENSIMKFQPRLDASFSMYLKMVLAFAVVFQMPTVVLFLARMGVVTGRFLMRHFKYAVLIIFIAAAIITPDGSPVTQTFIAGPMVGLYLFSVLLAWIFGKKRRTAEDDI